MGSNGGGASYQPSTWEERYICRYTNLNIYQVQEFDIFEHALYLRDAYIEIQRQTTEGREYLDKCYRMEQTEPDRAALRKQFGKGA